MTVDLTNEDRGKTVVSENERIGVVTDVADGTAYVDPDWDNVHGGLRDALGWDRDDEEHTIDDDAITAVGNSEVRLRDDLIR